MRPTLSLALLLASQLAAGAAETAYTALRTVGKQQGTGALNHVVEVRGRFGAPEPEVWKIVLEEASARGGVRELEVQRGRIISERTPMARGAGAPMNFNQLNLDSEGAFTVANQEARKAAVLFDRVDYTLKSGTRSGAPVWTLDLLDASRGRVGSLEIAADSGAVLRADLNRQGIPGRQETRRPREEEPADVYVEEPRGRRERVVVEERDYDRELGPGITDPRDFFSRVGRRFEKRGKQLKNFFTGRGFSEN